MNARKQKIEDLFHAAMELSPGGQRQEYLQQVCPDDRSLLRSVEELIEGAEIGEAILGVGIPGAASADGAQAGPQPGDRIGRFKLLERIGEGGCGFVYMAEQEEPVQRRVALKVIKPGMDTKSVIARFEAERQALAMMDHPHIAKVYDGGVTESGRPFFVMELVRGIRITDYCAQHQLSTRQRLDLFMQVCSAVQHAHQKGIIHRDLKPSNILVTEIDGRPVPKVIDFGIAKATEQKLTDKTLFTQFAQFVGTPAYMSPEQAAMSGADIDTRSDIYSLGVLLYELLTGSTPFDAKDLLHAGFDEMRRIIRETEPEKPSTRLTQTSLAASPSPLATRHPPLATDLDWIVMKCLEKDRARRYETASGLAMDIHRHLSSEPVTARPASAAYRFRKMVRRNKLAFAAAGAVLAALIIGLGVSVWQSIEKTRALHRAQAAEKAQSEERKKAETEASKSQQVATFLTDMLKGVGPSVALGDDTKMLRKILDKTVERIGEDLKDQPDVEADLRNIIGNVYLALGEYVKAGEMHAEVLTMRRKLLGNEHPLVATALNNLAGDLADQGKLAEAEALYREALAMSRKLSGHEPPDDATTLGNLASVLFDQGKLAEAETLQREALERERTRRGNEHPAVATSLSNFALMLQSKGKLAEAETTLREALAMQRKLLGSGHPDIATSLNNLGPVLLEQGKLAEAETTLREALAMKRKLLNNDHPEVAAAMLNFAHLLRRQQKLAEAESMYREALAMHRKFLGNDHPDVGASLNGLALALHFQGKGAEAEILLREAEAIAKKTLGNEHPDLAQVIDNLASIMEGQRKYAEAESLQREALAMSRKLLGHSHPHVTASLNNLGRVLQKQGKVEEATQLFRDDLTMTRPSAGNDPPEFERRLCSFADRLYLQSEYAEAEPLYRELIERRKARLGAEHEEVLSPTAGLAQVLFDWAWTERSPKSGSRNQKSEIAGRAGEAERLLRDCLAIRLRGADPADGRTDDVRSRLGGAVFAVAVTDSALTNEARVAKFTEAESLLLDSNEAIQKISQSGWSSYQRNALGRLVGLYKAWGKAEKAAAWQQKLADFDKAEAEKSTGTDNNAFKR